MNTANRAVFHTNSVVQTRALGRRLARLLGAGDIVLLQGPLGAGKTALAQGIGQGLKLATRVSSPTFVLLAKHETEGVTPLYHADLYRLTDVDEVADLALDAQAADGILLIEWPERGIEVLPDEHLLIVLDASMGEASQRRITIVANGERYRRVLDGLGARG
ncbi:MAG: tRNA (adenosine(37)-N6)-threonylcarbamoyltransferase complex ATPase subunit type 1 TsaE [Chloroflexi bacterium]|nr:tRNA (adenosine(37)-N6)-threonylcarbamoyltransferase complex ATPase subunit type 1 TsaE [Chloroflexota bacterium]MQC16608.1 tRNA (adenosine(37)-N6)-threonylcarbamoyltransferase complex ATPase subunit type 1 TsaE [Chloroflexota bacterium]